MDEYVTYLLAFAILVLISVVVSVSYKYDKDKGSDDGHPPCHSILDVETSLQSEIDTLRKIANLTATGDDDDHHIKYIETGNNNVYYTYDNGNKKLHRNSGEATIANLNSLFSHNVFYPVDWTATDVLVANDNYFSWGSEAAGTDSHMTYHNSNKTLSGNANNGNLYLIFIQRLIEWKSATPSTRLYINNRGELCVGNSPINIKLNPAIDATTDDNPDCNYRLVATTTNGNLRFSFLRRNIIGTNKNINNIEYFGITSANKYPLPYSIPNFLGNPDNDGNITTLNSLSQTLLQNFGTTRNFGLFAKTNTTEPTEGDPSSTNAAGYVGFTTNLTSDHLKIEYIATHYHSGEIIELPSLWISSEVKFQNQPYYSIYVVIFDDDDYLINNMTFVDTNSTTGTQTIIIFGSPRSGYKVANNDYGVFLSRDNTSFLDPLVNFTGAVANTSTNRIYKPHGNFNMNALAFMKFNNDGQKHGYRLNTQYDQHGWSITSTPTTGYEEYIPINYGTSNPYQITKADYLNYYRFNANANTYTHYFYNDSTGAWETAHPAN